MAEMKHDAYGELLRAEVEREILSLDENTAQEIIDLLVSLQILSRPKSPASPNH